MNNGQLAGMLAGSATIFFAYIGFDAISTQSEEARNPQRDVPIGIIARSSSAHSCTSPSPPCSRAWCLQQD